MKEYILRKERIFHSLSLVLIAGSLFLPDMTQKVIVLETGILGILILSALKRQKILVLIYLFLFIVAGIGYYLVTDSKLRL